jgi:hypothetical protein
MRVIAEALRRFPDATDYGFLWPRLLVAAEPLMARLPAEASCLSRLETLRTAWLIIIIKPYTLPTCGL